MKAGTFIAIVGTFVLAIALCVAQMHFDRIMNSMDPEVKS